MTSEPEKQRKIGPFFLERELGTGGMGVVYLGTYEKTGMKCAIKVLAPDLSGDEAVNQRFIRETEILKKLQHENIIRYYGAGSSRMQRFYAMELVEGGSLDGIIKAQGKLTWQETVEYGLQIAKALEHAHAAGIVHRDLKPANLLITKDGVLKLTDFGIARDTQATALTQAGKTVGTMAYMAPEQISGKKPVTRQTDLYALGCVLFEMLAGRTPFVSDNQATMLFKHLDDPPPSVRDFNLDVPIWLSKLIEELLSKEPENRPYDALAVQVRLQEVKEKVAKQEAKLKESTQGGVSALTQAYDAKTQAIKKKKKKELSEQPQVPFWEKPWFLGVILGAVLLGVTLAVLHQRSEETLYRSAEPYMLSQDAGDWIHAETTLKTLVGRYPEGKRAEQARTWLDQIGMYRAERRIETNVRLGKEPSNEAERLYVEAQQYEKFGDRLTALERYEAMPKVIANDDANRPFLNLARRQSEKIRGVVGSDTDRTVFIQKQLAEAEDLFLNGRKLLAQEKWQAIIRLYGSNAEFEVFTRQARDRLLESGGMSGSTAADSAAK